MSHTFRSILLIGTLALMAAACSSSGGGAASAPPAASVAPSVAPSEATPSEVAPSSPAAAGVSLAVADSSHGKIVVDGAGKTLYGFTPDEAGTPTCYDQCAANWPPVLADDAAAVSLGTGLDTSKLSVVDRTDGSKQVKYGEYPLYYFAADASAGDTNGQGLNSKWYVMSPEGEIVKN
ncbi:MAG TPA: hypothetical protein VFI69_06410 [Candidatus Limnocylindrales bacterium]|nr:hypothetical protein [Candidatus Limnocylindrales bacterium]